jgi:arylsulfatase A-like enzyme
LFGDRIKLHDWIISDRFVFGKILHKFSRDYSITVVPPKEVFKGFLNIIEQSPPEPYFAWIHIFPPHDPYLPTEEYMGIFESSNELKKYKEQYQLKQNLYEYQYTYNKFPVEIQKAVKTQRARYDEFIRYCDKQFKDFITRLVSLDKLKNTVIVLSSDHGESFEHDYPLHGGRHLYEQVTHIPLIIKEPGQKKGIIIDDLVEQIDIPATILDLAKIDVPSWIEGRSLVPLINGEELRSRPAFSMNLERSSVKDRHIKKGTVAVWTDGYKLIHYIEDEKSLLFDLERDPAELNNLADDKPERTEHLLGLIKRNLVRLTNEAKEGGGPDVFVGRQ